jgi:dTMP kinase
VTQPPALLARLRGKFVVLDGPDGCGKSTQCRRLVADLQAAGVEVVAGRDPGGTEIGGRIRSVLLDHDLSKMDPACETLLFMASRAQLVAEIIKPALQQAKTVICDRYVSSTCAYQGAAGVDAKRVIELAAFAIGDTWPDVTVVIDVDPEEGMRRIGKAGDQRAGRKEAEVRSTRSSRPDAMERRSLDFHRRVRDGFQTLSAYYPRRVVIVNGTAGEDVVYERVLEAISNVLS